MKRVIQGLTVLLALSGFLLTPIAFVGNELITWVHLILGFFYTVIFLLFSYDHIIETKRDLKKATTMNLTGLIQLTLGSIVLITGFWIYLTGSTRLGIVSEAHLAATILFLASLALHFSKKKKQDPHD
ncbi:MAG: hypothetical protein QNL04_10630 [SAR324 cluster bacterium]|nr:hypothetical protein [SAR324 cluster bacterium]